MALVITVVIPHVLASLSLCVNTMMMAKLYAETCRGNKGL